MRAILLIDVALTIVAVALIWFGDTTMSGGVWTKRLRGLFMLVPAAAILFGLGQRPRAWLYGVTAATALSIGLTAYVLPAAAAMGAAEHAAQLGALLGLSWVWAAVQLVLVVWVVRVVRKIQDPGAGRQAWIGFFSTFIWPIAATTISAAVGGAADDAAFHRTLSEEAALRTTVVAIAGCAFKQSESTTGLYPQSLEAMGPSGTKCLDRSILKNAAKYGVEYHVVPSDDSSTGTFRVSGRAVRLPGTPPWMTSLVVDTSGVVRRNEYAESDTVERIRGDNIPVWLVRARDCVELIAERGGAIPSADALMSLFAQSAAVPLGCLSARVALVDSALSTDVGYRMTYEATDGYRLIARPIRYGITAFRSYLLDSAGVLHFTRLDRAASEQDQSLPECLAYDWGDCVPIPSSRAPRALFVHDSVVRDDRQYVLRVRVEGNAAHIPEERLAWIFECDVRTPDDSAPPAGKSFRGTSRNPADETCAPLSSPSRPAARDVVLVRLWLQGPNGTIRRMQDSIRVLRGSVPGR